MQRVTSCKGSVRGHYRHKGKLSASVLALVIGMVACAPPTTQVSEADGLVKEWQCLNWS